MVKRVVREAARHHAGALDAALAGKCLYVLFRLKAPLPGASAATWAALKTQLRGEADGLLEQLLERVRKGSLGSPGARRPANPQPRDRTNSLAQSGGSPGTCSPLPATAAAGEITVPKA
jgi:hypothetical protein